MGVLPAALGGDIGHRALQDFQQGLLHALAGDIPGDGGIFTLSGDFIHLVDVNNPPLRLLDVIVCSLHQAQQDVLHVIPHIAGFGQGGGVRDGKGNLQNLGQGLGQQRLSAAGGAQQEDVALLQLHIVPAAKVNALIMIVNRHGQGHFGGLLPDDIFIQIGLDLLGAGNDLRHIRAHKLLLRGRHII